MGNILCLKNPTRKHVERSRSWNGLCELAYRFHVILKPSNSPEQDSLMGFCYTFTAKPLLFTDFLLRTAAREDPRRGEPKVPPHSRVVVTLVCYRNVQTTDLVSIEFKRRS